MPIFPRLIRLTALDKEQKLATNNLMNSEGLCTCGRFLNKTDAKFCLGQVNTNLFPDPKGKNTLIIAGYCFSCFQSINGVLKMLKNSNSNNEPDRVRHEGK